MERLIYVGCVVKENKLYDLLRALELHKVGNVEVRPVAPTILDEAEPDGPIYKGMRGRIWELFADGRQWRHAEIMTTLNAPKSSVGSSIDTMLRNKHIKRIAHGLYAKR